ncbi:MAG: hypothetical protein K0U78_16340 [Actinomycetia bacterium]|nr:hypothetical protein [Actinomycetes bacterium]
MFAQPGTYMREGRFDVGRIVRDASRYYLEEKRATRKAILALLDRLNDFTRELPIAKGGMPPESIFEEFQAWNARLDRYRELAEAAPQGNSKQLNEGVVGPLLLGWYEGDDTQRVADIATPFTIANQLEVSREWRRERLSLLFDDLKEEAEDVAQKAAGGGLVLVLAALGWALFGGGD